MLVMGIVIIASLLYYAIKDREAKSVIVSLAIILIVMLIVEVGMYRVVSLRDEIETQRDTYRQEIDAYEKNPDQYEADIEETRDRLKRVERIQRNLLIYDIWSGYTIMSSVVNTVTDFTDIFTV